jgi:hypothetical protein
MHDTFFSVPPEKMGRYTVMYAPDGAGGLKVFDDPANSEYLADARHPRGSSGLSSTASDGWMVEAVMLGPATHITQQGKAIQASQLSSDTGSHVSVTYTEANGQKHAQTVSVTPASTKTAKK